MPLHQVGVESWIFSLWFALLVTLDYLAIGMLKGSQHNGFRLEQSEIDILGKPNLLVGQVFRPAEKVYYI